MKKIFTLMTLLVAMVTNAWGADEVLLTYTVPSTATVTAKTALTAGSGTVTPGNSWTTSESGDKGWKMDGDPTTAKAGSKYALATLATGVTFKEGDIISITGYSASKATTSSPQGFSLYNGAGGSSTLTQYGHAVNTTSAKNTSFTVTFEIGTGSGLIGANSVYVFRYFPSGDKGLSSYFQGITVTRPAASQVATPTISPANGSIFSSASETVTITSASETTVYYTTDGTTPTTSSTKYTAPFSISSTTTVKAIAIDDNGTLDDSDVATATITKVTAGSATSWNFTGWSAATKDGTIADTDGWSQYEKTGSSGTDFGDNGRSNIAALTAGSTLKYGSTTIAETDGLTFEAGAYGLGLMYNLPSATVSGTVYNYHGGQYLWLYSNNSKITIPNVKANSVITIGVESHNGSDARGVTLSGVSGITQTVGDATSTDYQDCSWLIPADGDIVVTPTKGLHIYYITVQEYTPTVNAVIGATGWATFSANQALDFSGVSGLSAYMVTGASGTTITKSDAVKTVPANTGLLLNGAAGSYDIPVVASSSTSTTANKLVAGTGAEITSSTGSGFNYVLVDNSGTAVFQKIESTSATVAIGKAYLALTENPAGARTLGIDDGGATGIETIKVGTENNVYYDLQGRRVLYPTKGLYIVNGKKVILK